MKGLIIISLGLFILSCNQEKEVKYIELIGEAQGTTFFISYFDSLNRDFSDDIFNILTDFDSQVSTYKKGSGINEFNNNKLDTVWKLDYPYLHQSFIDSKELKKYTNYHFDVGIYPIIQYLKSIDSIPTAGNKTFDSIRASINRDYLATNNYVTKLDPRSQFNFNAIAQGYSVDVVCDYLNWKGIKNYMVEIGGEVKVKGKSPSEKLWIVSLEAPNSEVKNRKVQESISLNNKSVVTSGSYRKFKEIDGVKYSHAINPKTGLGVTHNLLSVSVITEECAIADALATAFLVMGKEKTIELLDSNNQYNVSLLFIESNSDSTFESSFYGGFEEYLVK